MQNPILNNLLHTNISISPFHLWRFYV